MKKSFPTLVIPVALAVAAVVLAISGLSFFSGKNCGCGQNDLRAEGNFDPSATVAYFQNQPITYNWPNMLSYIDFLEGGRSAVLGETNEEKWIEVDLSEQRLFAHEGDKIAFDFLISSGKPWTPTVQGEFRIWGKYKYAKMSGGTPGTKSYYYLPNVPFIQYFHRDYGLHGAYWHNNFGQTMSHGCVNISIPDSEKLFYWTSPVLPEGKNYVRSSEENPGTRVIIHS